MPYTDWTSLAHTTQDYIPVANVVGAMASADLSDTTNVANGDALIGVKQPFTGAVARTQHQKNSDIRYMDDFGAVGDGVTNNNSAFTAAATWAATKSDSGNSPCLKFKSGRYLITPTAGSEINWAINGLHLDAEGEVWIVNAGTGIAMNFNGYNGSGGSYGVRMTGNFIIYGQTGSSHALYTSDMNRGYFEAKIRGAGTTSYGHYCLGCVLSEFHVSCSSNEGGFVSTPNTAIRVTSSHGLQTSYSTWINAIAEGTAIGIYLDGALGNTFVGGSAEGCTTFGVQTTTSAYNNKFLNMDFEVNTVGDVSESGHENEYIGCDSYTVFYLEAVSKNNKILGGAHRQITCIAGSSGNLITQTRYNRFNTGFTITDGGTNELVENFDVGAGTWSSGPLHKTTISDATASTSPTTGALVVTGGTGIGGAVNLGSTLVAASGYLMGVNVYSRSAGGDASYYFYDANNFKVRGVLSQNQTNYGFSLTMNDATGATIDSPIFIANANGGGITIGGSSARPSSFTGSIKSTNATAGVGYGTGAGGTITQGTGRTTGVTLNKICGEITLVSAAGSTTPASFTVTNSAVAATDTIVLNQKSGTDKYVLLVTAVAAGSFEITAYTTGGTTTEQPVINFSVIKAVSA